MIFYFILLGIIPGFFKMIIDHIKGVMITENFPIGHIIKVCYFLQFSIVECFLVFYIKGLIVSLCVADR